MWAERNRERLRKVKYLQTFNCERCGVSHTNRRGEQRSYCSRTCSMPKQQATVKTARKDLRGPLRTAWEAGDWATVGRQLLARTERQLNGCYLWTGGVDSDGYAEVKVAKRRYKAYRMMASATHGRQISGIPVHHRCANRRCITPEHLELTTHSTNTVEMLQRRWYIARIDELERALEAIDPAHPLLARLPFAA